MPRYCEMEFVANAGLMRFTRQLVPGRNPLVAVIGVHIDKLEDHGGR